MIGVASIARVVTPELLPDVLPGLEATPAPGLAGRALVRGAAGGRDTLHELVRRAARADLRATEPERERELRRRIADHLYEHAAAGQTLLTVDLAALVDADAIRTFYGWDGARPTASTARAARTGRRSSATWPRSSAGGGRTPARSSSTCPSAW